jgi:hypothetical protein
MRNGALDDDFAALILEAADQRSVELGQIGGAHVHATGAHVD